MKSQLIFVATLLPMCLLGGSPRLKHGSRLHCEIANMPPKRCRHGKAAAKAKAKAVAKAVAKAKMVAKAQAKAKARARVGRANSRRQHRRQALAELNALAGECGYGSTRVYFGVVLSRGVLGVAVFTDVAQFPGETPEGVRLLVERLPGVLDEMLGCSSKKPRTLFTDRGSGFYHRRWGDDHW